MPSQDTVKWSSLCLLLLSLCLALPVPSPADDGLLQQVDIGLLSIGGRAMYYDPKEGDANWYGGAQVRLHPWHYFAIEGSADYRRNDYAGGPSAHSYPVQVSALIYPLGTTRLAPFILGGRLVLHHRHRAGGIRQYAEPLRASCGRRAAVLLQSTFFPRQHLSLYLARKDRIQGPEHRRQEV